MDITDCFDIKFIEEFQNDENSVLAALTLNALDEVDRKIPLQVYLKIDLIKKTYELYAVDPTEIKEEYADFFRLFPSNCVMDIIIGRVLKKLFRKDKFYERIPQYFAI